MEFLSRPFHSRTVSNCWQKQTPSAAAAAPPKSDDVEMGGGNTGGDAGNDVTENQGVVDETTRTPILHEDGQPVRELVETPKPKKKCTMWARERDEMALKVLNMLKKDEDEVTLALTSIGKRIMKSLSDAQVDVLDELNEVVGHHVRTARGGGVMGYQRQPSVQQLPEMQRPPQQQQTNNYQLMPPLQRMDIGYDPMTNNSYQIFSYVCLSYLYH